ncbi:hypothetical protein TomTYG75_00460 [Sphingobium sp. TomTYG75]
MLRYGTENGRAPVVFIPSLINPPQVLDLSEGRSMLRHMAAAGHDAYLVDWGSPRAEDAHLDLEHHVTKRLLTLLESLPQQPILVGYCLGGSLALGAAAVAEMKAVATIAAPWQFDGFPDADRNLIASLWRGAKATSEQLGYVPMEVLQSGFWAMDPARTIRKYAAFAGMELGSEAERAFLAVEDWANGGSPLTFAAGQELFENFYGRNITGHRQWRVDGKTVDPESLRCPTFSVRSATDRIVPASAAPELAEGFTLQLGHVGMIVGSNARHLLWDPLSLWLSTHGG